MKTKHKWYEFIFPVIFLALSVFIIILGATPGSQSGAQSKTVASIFDFGPKEATIIKPKSISITGSDTIYINKEETYTITFNPTDTSDQRVSYTLLDNEGEASISSNKVKGIKEGEVTLQVTSLFDKNIKGSKTIKIEKEPITSLEIKVENTSIVNGMTEMLMCNANRKISLSEIDFISSDENILSLDERGYLHSHQIGDVSIYIKSKEYETSSNTLNIKVIDGLFVAPTSISYQDIELYVGEKEEIVPILSENNSDDHFYMTSNNESIRVNGKTITAKKEGESIITLTSIQNNLISSTFKVTIKEVKATSLTVSNASIQYGKGTNISYTLVSEKEGLSVTYQDVDFICSDTSIASVDDNGYVVGLKKGTVMITVLWKRDTSIKAECSVAITSLEGKVFDNIELLVRKLLGHFGAFLVTAVFGVLSVFFIFYRHKEINRKVSIILISIVFVYGFILATLSELAQMLTVARGPAWTDVGIDFGGYVVGFLVTTLIVLLINKLITKSKIKEQI